MRLNLGGKKRGRNGSARALYLFFAYISVAIIMGIWFLEQHHQLLRDSATTTATILSSDRSGVEYGFHVDGAEFRGSETGNHYKGPNVIGSQVKVTYSKPDPTFNTLTPDENFNNGRLLLSIGLGGIATVGGLIALAKLNLFPNSVATSRESSDAGANRRRVRNTRTLAIVSALFTATYALVAIKAWLPLHRIDGHPGIAVAEITGLDSQTGDITYRFAGPHGFVTGSTNTRSYSGPRAVGLGVLVDYAVDDANVEMLDFELSKRKTIMSLFMWLSLPILGLLLAWTTTHVKKLRRSRVGFSE